MSYTNSQRNEWVRLGLVIVFVALVSGLVLLGQHDQR
jgi:hypothetical protein